jgi:hypothetical protein
LDLAQPFLAWLKNVYRALFLKIFSTKLTSNLGDPLHNSSVDSDKGTEPLLDVPNPPAVPEEDPFAESNPVTADLDSWAPTNVNVSPELAVTPQSPLPIVTDNHLRGDGSPSEPIWMAFGGHPPATTSLPTLATEPQEIPIDPALIDTTHETGYISPSSKNPPAAIAPPEAPHIGSSSSPSDPPAHSTPAVAGHTAPIRVDQPGSVSSIILPHSEAHVFASDSPASMPLSRDNTLPVSGTPSSHPPIPSDARGSVQATPSYGPQIATPATPPTLSPPPSSCK